MQSGFWRINHGVEAYGDIAGFGQCEMRLRILFWWIIYRKIDYLFEPFFWTLCTATFVVEDWD